MTTTKKAAVKAPPPEGKVRPDILTVVAEMNKKFGEGTVVLASTTHAMIPRIPTGSLGLDLILGGGWPANQWVEIIGDPSSGKTAIALKTIAANQARDPEFTAVWIAAEQWVTGYAEMCGVDPSRLYVVETNVMEEAYDIAIQIAESQQVDAIVIDSLPALVPAAEDEKEMGESTVGRGALLTGKFFRKVGMASKRSLVESERPILGIVINQWRMKIGVMFGDPRTSPGGLGKDYAYFAKIDVRRDDWIDVGVKDDAVRIGQTMKVRTTKNKTAPPQQVCYVDFYFKDHPRGLPRGDYDFAKEVGTIAVIERIVEKKGSWYKYGGDQWQGFDGLLQAIREDVDLHTKLTDEVKAVVEAVGR